VCCSVLQCVAMCCSVFQGVPERCDVLRCIVVEEVISKMYQIGLVEAVCCNVLQRVAVCCRGSRLTNIQDRFNRGCEHVKRM